MKNRMVVGSMVVVVLGFVTILLALSGPSIGRVFDDVSYGFGSGGDGGFDGESSLEADDFLNYAPVTDLVREQVQEEPIGQERVILRNATVDITVEDVLLKINTIGSMAEEMGGWIVSSNTSQQARGEETVYFGNVTIRIPADRLDDALEQIKTGVGTVNAETVTGRDVTTEYVDLSGRLANLETAEAGLQAIMDEAKTVEDVLNVYNELVRIRGEIESVSGRLQYFDEAAAFSSIQVQLRPPELTVVEVQSTGWNPGTTVEGALSVLLGLGQFLVDAVIVLVIVGVPLVILIGLPGWWLYRRTQDASRSVGAEA